MCAGGFAEAPESSWRRFNPLLVMLLGANYAASDSEEDTPTPTPTPTLTQTQTQAQAAPLSSLPSVVAAPPIPNQLALPCGLVTADTNNVYNVSADVMWAPLVGPVNPLTQEVVPSNNAVTGRVESTTLNDYNFDEQYYKFRSAQQVKAPAYKKRKKKGDAADVNGGFQGPWASYEDEEVVHIPDDEEEPEPETAVSSLSKAKKPRVEKALETSKFHGKELTDYQGRTYMHYPSTMKPHIDKCYHPTRQIHTWTGHSKGVNAIRFFPRSGHLLLSCSMDKKIKLWDVHNQRRVLRTFLGHSAPVRDICFTNDGRHFLSASYDRHVKYWDTETGQCIRRFTTGKIPYCVRLNPSDSKQNEFLAGQADKKIIQWDTNSGNIVQSYDEHLGAVNSVLFVDDNRRFVSTSDDKKVLIWEYGIPVVMKHISEPDMHSMPVTALHPSGKFFIGQSLDNQVLVFSCKDRFRLNRKKRFTGHRNAGYAAELSFSPCGNFVLSGDADGRVFFWDWKTTRCYQKLKAHDQVAIGCVWNPAEASKVATCSWDGTIKYWA